jgi:quercetin dioxygenase-like cupin family protein
MTYLGATLTDPLVAARPRDQVPVLESDSSAIRFVAPGAVTQGEFGLFEYRLGPRGAGPGPHFHRTFSESFYVVSGELTVYADNEWRKAGAGDYLHVHRGGVHGFRNDSDRATTFLILFAPGSARERYFTELHEIRRSGRTLTDAEWADLYARHDQVNL